MENLSEMFFFSLLAGITFHFLPRRLSLCVAYLAVKTHDLYTVFILEFMCYSDKAHWVRCVCLRTLWVFIESADCRTAYCRTQTLFRGNAQPQQFPIPFLISSIPSWVMSIYHLSMRCCIAIWKWHVFRCTHQAHFDGLYVGARTSGLKFLQVCSPCKNELEVG